MADRGFWRLRKNDDTGDAFRVRILQGRENFAAESWFCEVTVHKRLDVLGHLVERGDLKTYDKNGRTSSYIQFVLEDVSANRLPCTFWGGHAEELDQKLVVERSNISPVLLIQLCKVKSFRGTVGISNAFHGTKLYFNSNIPEINDYRQRMESPYVPLTQSITQVVAPPQLTLAEEMLQTRRMTISNLLEATDVGYCGVLARIIEIESQHGWVYDSCNRCLGKVSRVANRFYCDNPKCSQIVTGIPRFKVEAKVIDDSGSTTFVMINRVVSSFLGVTAEQLMETTPPDSPFPAEFETLIERELLFKIEILDGNLTQNWLRYSVKRITADPAIISAYVGMYPLSESQGGNKTELVGPSNTAPVGEGPSEKCLSTAMSLLMTGVDCDVGATKF